MSVYVTFIFNACCSDQDVCIESSADKYVSFDGENNKNELVFALGWLNGGAYNPYVFKQDTWPVSIAILNNDEQLI